MMGVYIIQNKVDGRFYVGHSVDIDKRFIAHKSYLRRDCHHCIFLQRAWNKYGEDNFEFTIIKECSLEDSINLEQYYLDNCKFDLYNTGKLAKFGGDLISNNPNRDVIIEMRRQTTIKRMSEMSSEDKKQVFGRSGERNNMFGKKHSLDSKVIMSKKHLGSIPINKNMKLEHIVGIERASEIKEHLSEIAKKRIGVKNSFFGKIHSDKTKERISQANLGHKPINRRKVSVNGAIYDSVTNASRALKVVPATIIHRIKSSNELYKDYSYIDDL